jgi:hypothetical protein
MSQRFFGEDSFDRLLRQRAAAWPECRSLDELTSERLRDLGAREGIDFATAVLYDRIRQSTENGPFIARIEALQERAVLPRLEGVTFAVAPGAFWRELPRIQSDGRLLRDVAADHGCRTAMIPVASTGPLCENARSILEWVAQQPKAPILLASLSKGGADVKLAIHAEPSAFRHVVAWINICGMLNGTPLVEFLHSRPLPRTLLSWFFRWRGLDFRMVHDLDARSHSLLADPLRLPGHIRLISVIGFPLRNHMRNRRARLLRGVLDPLGPNDGGVLLEEVCRLPGQVFPVWGADHYMQPEQMDIRSLTAALLSYLADELSLSEWCGQQTATNS